MKKILNRLAIAIAFFLSVAFLLASIFELQYRLMLGPLIDAIVFLGLGIFGLIFSLIVIFSNLKRGWKPFLPLLLIAIGFSLSFLIPNYSFSHRLHFSLNKESLTKLDELSSENGIYDLTDMLRYHKRINQKTASGDRKLRSQSELVSVFGNYLTSEQINIESIVELRETLEKSNTISLVRSEDFFILPVDGFVDNEYGYIKTENVELKLGDTLPPYGFVIVRLIELGEGWYFYFTT